MFKFLHSMRFRVWFLFIGFTTIILAFLYVNQVLLLPTFYTFIKTQETTGTANVLKKYWDSESLIYETQRLSQEHEMWIVVNKYVRGSLFTYSADPENMFRHVAFGQQGENKLFNDVLHSRNHTVTEIIDIDGRQMLRYATLVGSANDIKGYIVIFNFLQPLENTQNILKSQFFLSSCVIFLVAFILSAFVVAGISNPIIKISRSAGKLAKGEFDMKTRKVDYAEIKTLADNLNKASREIAKTENLRKDLLANVSHDLKTPLTMIKAYAEMIRDLSGDNPEKREKHVKVIIDEADRLNGLVVDMLDLSKIQSGVAKKELAVFNFSQHLNVLIERFGYLSNDLGINFITEITKDIFIKADLPKIEQVIYNLTNNAVNYTGEDKKVFVRLFVKKDGVGRFEVGDTGSGIAKEEIPYIWERYYKAAKSQFHKRTSVGTGLGLSIVKGVMEIHGYAFGVDSTVGKGSTFWFEFPCEKNDKI